MYEIHSIYKNINFLYHVTLTKYLKSVIKLIKICNKTHSNIIHSINISSCAQIFYIIVLYKE